MRNGLIFGMVLALGAMLPACSEEVPVVPPTTTCTDGDGDGFDNCVDCDDTDPAVHPGADERCNGKDDNCDGVVDEGCECTEGDAPRACGFADSGCVQACEGGKLGVCQPPSGPIDTEADPQHCGECGRVCPTPLNAPALCTHGVCGRGPCAPGTFDFDLATTPGCEVQCEGKACTDLEGNPIDVDSPPVPETGLKHLSAHSGSSHGAGVQTTASHTNTGFLGPALNGPVESANGDYTNYGGFTAAERK